MRTCIMWICIVSAQLTLSCSTTGRDPARAIPTKGVTESDPAGTEKLRAISARAVPSVLSRPNATADQDLPTLGTAHLELLDDGKSSASSTR